MDLGIKGKRAVVSAASVGLGFSTAKALTEAGAVVVICGRDQQRLKIAVSALGGNSTGLIADVSTIAGAENFMDQAIEQLGGVDILVTNGGGPPAGGDESISAQDYGSALEANLTAMIAMCRKATPPMKSQQWGRIVAITSVSVRQPIPNLILSNTSRAGFTAYLKTLSKELAPHGITVNSAQPGLHATDRLKQLYGDSDPSVGVPMGVLGDPSDFGSVVAFLCSNQAKFITGAHLPVDGGAYSGLQ